MKEIFKKGNRKRILTIGFFTTLTIFFLIVNTAEAHSNVYYGQIVGIEFTVIQVRGDDGRISVFWLGYKTRLDSRVPFFGNRVRIEYIKDAIGRNAVTRIAIWRNK